MKRTKSWLVIVCIALVIGGLLGLLAATFEPVTSHTWITGAAFGLIGFVGSGAVTWVIWAARTDPALARTENKESVEHAWPRRAGSAAFFDVMVVVSLSAAFFSITRFEVPVQFVLAGVIVVALADMGIRRAVLEKRES